MHVVIIGAGIGGLTLAQGLKRAGVSVSLYERDRTRTERLQGYRIHIAPYGCRALHACLPADVYDLFVSTSGQANSTLAFFTEKLDELITLNTTEIGMDTAHLTDTFRSVSRITFREVLLAGLGDVVRFGKTFTHYTHEPDGLVTAHFSDGTQATGDVLVGADGTNSAVRAQYLPQAAHSDTGAVAISGKVPLGSEVAQLLPRPFSTGGAMVLAPHGYFGFLAVHEFRRDEGGQALSLSPDYGIDPELLLDNTTDYVMWNVLARWQKFGDRKAISAMSAEEIRALVLRTVGGWHPNLLRLIEESDTGTVSVHPLYTSRRPEPWQPSNVTVLGDAIHAMPPTAGAGANAAVVDAELLCRGLRAVGDGRRLTDAIGEYEKAMLDHAFTKVAAANRNLEQGVADNRFALAGFRTFLRLAGNVGPIRRKMTAAIAR
ncbi:FAD-dependent monooxygenase [Streptomyces sp. NBC_00210]|uniref:FAD-dependent oxidoreductase n=1 Tax=Streptomyces sp. NBC_00210 TaxID=2903636 RepID=UPI0032524A1D